MVDLEKDNFANEPYELMVRDYLSAQLEPQVGRAEAKFRQMLAERDSAGSRSMQSCARPMRHRFTSWSIGLVGAALAASLGALWAVPSLHQLFPEHNPSEQIVKPAQAVNPIYVEHRTDSQTFDDGTFITSDNTPMRVLRRRDMERTRWFDKDQKLTGEQVTPQDHVIYVKLKTY